MKTQKKKVAVFCGSRKGNLPIYEKSTLELAKIMVDSEIDLVYGGGNIGLMGVLADEIMRLGGSVYGVIPRKIMDMEVGHEGITELHIVDTMHERKAMMAQMADGFIALPGGIGTIEEIIEVYTWKQLGYHHKPCGFLNVDGYYDALLTFLDQMVQTEFLSQNIRDEILVSNTPSDLLSIFKQQFQ